MWEFISGLIKPVTDLISEAVEDVDAANKLKAEMFKLQTDVSVKMMDYESQLLTAQSSIIVAEAQGGSWLQKSWRPMLMIFFTGLLGSYWLGYSPENMTQETLDRIFDLITLGIGGYIGGRSLEKIVPKAIEAMKK